MDTAVARHYSDRKGLTFDERRKSDILALRELNNWVKSELILACVRLNDFVLDLACGKGGDLPKWKEARVGAYCGVDVALRSVRSDARSRYNLGKHKFPAALFVADCFGADLPRALLPAFGTFDVVSCQFALHYAFATEARARRAIANVAALLRPGGVFVGTTADADALVRKLRAARGARFGNDVYSVSFGAGGKVFPSERGPFGHAYSFTLSESVDGVEEYLVHQPTLVALAAGEGLTLRLWSNFHAFTHARLAARDDARAAWTKRGLGGLAGPPPLGEEEGGADAVAPPILTDDEWEVAGLYAAFEFVKEPADASSPPLRDTTGMVAQFIDPQDVRALTTSTRFTRCRTLTLCTPRCAALPRTGSSWTSPREGRANTQRKRDANVAHPSLIRHSWRTHAEAVQPRGS